MAIAWLSLAKHRVSSVFSWQRRDLDRVLVLGDELRDLGEFSHWSNMLSVPDLPKQFDMDGQVVHFDSGDTVLGDVSLTETADFGVCFSLRDVLERVVGQHSTCLLTMCGNTSAIIRER